MTSIYSNIEISKETSAPLFNLSWTCSSDCVVKVTLCSAKLCPYETASHLQLGNQITTALPPIIKFIVYFSSLPCIDSVVPSLFYLQMPAPSRGTSHDDENASLLSSSQKSSSTFPDPITITQTTRTILYFMAIHFCIAFTDIITVAPLIKLFETSLCETFYGFSTGGVGGSDCKVLEIQQALAKVRGVKSGLWVVIFL